MSILCVDDTKSKKIGGNTFVILGKPVCMRLKIYERIIVIFFITKSRK